MLRALYERQIAPELIVGASAGSFNGAFIASRPATPETAHELAAVWRSTKTLAVFPPNPVTAALGLIGERDHLVPNAGVKAMLEAHAQFRRLEDAPISFHVVATDVLGGRERLLSEGDALNAVLASSAIPGVFPSIEFEGHRLIDGGVANNTPISEAVALGASTVYVLPTGAPCELRTRPRGAISMLVHALTLLINQRLVGDIERFSDQVELIVLPPPCPLDVLPSDFGHAAELIERSYELARLALAQPDLAGHLTPRSLERLRPHEHY